MALQLRVRDGLRTRVVQVEERGAERPVRVGSGPECEIRVGGAVAAVQCELFIHRGRWVVKGIEATRVNEKFISNGVYLRTEDRILIGEGEQATVIEVGPMAVAATADAGTRPMTPDGIPELAATGEEGWLHEDQDEWVPLPAAGTAARRRTPRRARSTNGMGWTVFLTLLIAGGGAVAMWKLRLKQPAAAPAPVARQQAAPIRTTAPTTTPTHGKANIFDTGWRSRPEQTATNRNPASDDPRKREDAWVELINAVNGQSAARAVFLIEEYRSARPGVFEAELKKHSEEALDRIWWERIRELCDRRDGLRAEIQEVSDAIAEETEEEFRERLEADRSRKEAELRWGIEILTREMGYVDKDAPNLADEQMIAKLREQRNSTLYETWKGKVVRSIKATRGYLPWERAR